MDKGKPFGTILTRFFALLLLFAVCVRLIPARVAPGAQGGEPRQASSPEWDAPLSDVEGRKHWREEWREKRALVFFFLEAECPISNRYSPEINRIVAEYTPKNFAFYGVLSDPSPSARDRGLKAVQDFDYRFPVLLDPTQILAKRTSVTVTPEVAVLSPRGELLYRGRIDDLYMGLGKFREKPTRRDLQLTLDAIAAGLPIPAPVTKAVGCYLPTPPGER